MLLDQINPTAGCRRYAVLRRDPQPLVRVCWLRFADDNSIERGHGEDLVPADTGRRIARAMARACRCDTWVEIRGNVG